MTSQHNLTPTNAGKPYEAALTKKRGLPQFLFLSDEKRIKNLTTFIARLPKQCGIILRDYNNPERDELIKKIIKTTKNSSHVVFVANAGNKKLNRRPNEHWPNTGRNGQTRKSPSQLITTSAHNLRDIGRANRIGVDAVILSPLFATKSHPKAKPLNIHRFVRLARYSKKPVYALGGLNLKKITQLKGQNIANNFAGISMFENTTDG